MDVFLISLGVAGALGLLTSLRVLYEYERGVIFRLGKLTRAKGPGLIFLVPFGIERLKKMDLRIVALDIAPQDTISRDNVSLKVNAVVYFRVVDPTRAVIEIEDYYFATSQLAQTTLRSVIGQSELDEVLAERDKINETVRKIIDEGTDAWGVEVTGVEVKDIDLPKEMRRAMAKQAEAERERRGKVIAAEGEYQASTRLSEAAAIMEQHPTSLQLRYLQTAVEIAAENNSTTWFPIPLEFFPSMGKGKVPAMPPFLQTSDADAESDSTALPAADSDPADRALQSGASSVAAASERALPSGAGATEPEAPQRSASTEASRSSDSSTPETGKR